MIRQNDLDKNKVHFGLFMRALKDAPADKVTVQVEGQRPASAATFLRVRLDGCWTNLRLNGTGSPFIGSATIE